MVIFHRFLYVYQRVTGPNWAVGSIHWAWLGPGGASATSAGWCKASPWPWRIRTSPLRICIGCGFTKCRGSLRISYRWASTNNSSRLDDEDECWWILDGFVESTWTTDPNFLTHFSIWNVSKKNDVGWFGCGSQALNRSIDGSLVLDFGPKKPGGSCGSCADIGLSKVNQLSLLSRRFQAFDGKLLFWISIDSYNMFGNLATWQHLGPGTVFSPGNSARSRGGLRCEMETRRQLFTQLSWRKSIPNCWCWSLFDVGTVGTAPEHDNNDNKR